MSSPIPEGDLLHVTDRESWHAWLVKNYKSSDGIWLIYNKADTGLPRVSYNDAVEEALCFGWIDSTVRTIDDDRYAQKFSPRRPGSTYSQANIERLRLLVDKGRVVQDVLGDLPDLSVDDFEIPVDILDAIKAKPAAWENFQGFSDAYIRIRIAYIEAARNRPGEFSKRLANFVRKTEAGKLIGYGGIEKYY